LSAREIPRLGCEAQCGRVAPAGLILTEIASDAISQAESSLSDSTGPRRQRDSTRSYSFGCGRGARHTLDRFRRAVDVGPAGASPRPRRHGAEGGPRAQAPRAALDRRSQAARLASSGPRACDAASGGPLMDSLLARARAVVLWLARRCLRLGPCSFRGNQAPRARCRLVQHSRGTPDEGFHRRYSQVSGPVPLRVVLVPLLPTA
jgi:hypothetical protein